MSQTKIFFAISLSIYGNEETEEENEKIIKI